MRDFAGGRSVSAMLTSDDADVRAYIVATLG
jgi:CheY-like chemotaxis protein